jgi:hypothetical protein
MQTDEINYAYAHLALSSAVARTTIPEDGRCRLQQAVRVAGGCTSRCSSISGSRRVHVYMRMTYVHIRTLRKRYTDHYVSPISIFAVIGTMSLRPNGEKLTQAGPSTAEGSPVPRGCSWIRTAKI